MKIEGNHIRGGSGPDFTLQASQKVRERIKAGKWPFGRAISPKKKGGQITYDIYARRMYQFFGMEIPDMENAPGERQLP